MVEHSSDVSLVVKEAPADLGEAEVSLDAKVLQGARRYAQHLSDLGASKPGAIGRLILGKEGFELCNDFSFQVLQILFGDQLYIHFSASLWWNIPASTLPAACKSEW